MASSLPRIIPPDASRIAAATARALIKVKKVDPRERYVLLFPGQDAAQIRMGFKLLNNQAAENVYDHASERLKKNVLKLCLQGPREELLESAENRLVATYVTSHATLAKLSDQQPDIIPFCKAAAGVGVGFINSLVFSKAMTFEDGLDLVQRQGHAIDTASKVVPSARLLIHFGPATRKIKMCKAAMEHCVKKGIPKEVAACAVTRFIHDHLIEVSGHEEAIRFIEVESSRFFHLKSIKRLPENSFSACHTDLMQPVKEYMKVYIKSKIEENSNYISEPETCSVYTATAARRLRQTEDIINDLVRHPVKPLKVEQLLHCLYRRPAKLAQPNSLILWDGRLLKNLLYVNRRAWDCAKLVEA